MNVSKDLEQLANGLVKKFERLQVLNKKDFNDGSNSLKKCKKPNLKLLTIFLLT